MKKIVIIDGGPRKTMNTAAMIEAFTEGVKAVSDDIEVKHIRLYDLDYKGCVACMACKVKNSKYTEVCARKDGATEARHEAAYADGLVFASPIYFFRPTGEILSFIERLFFPWLSYETFTCTPPKKVPTATIYTMNASPEYDMKQIEQAMNQMEFFIEWGHSKPERICAYNTKQVKNYDRYAFASQMVESKQPWHEAHWQEEVQHAVDAGRRMAEKIMNAK